MSLTISKTVKKYPTLPYQKIKEGVIGKKYNLTLVFIGSARALTLNKTCRNKTYVPNVLSFPLDESTGEIYIAPDVAAREAKKFNMTPRGYVGYLFIHGLLHLKGYPHGATMEEAEKKCISKYKLK